MNVSNNKWKKICAACSEGTPPKRCAYYGDPNGCNAPTLGKHPEGDLAERLQDELEKAERRIAELERVKASASKMRKALEYVLRFDATDKAAEEDGLTDAERIAEYADHIEECQKKARAALAASNGK